MIRAFLKERLSWTLLFFGFLGLLFFLGYIDPSLSLDSIGYIAFLLTLVFIFFTLIRFNRETPFYKSLKNWQPGDDLAEIRKANTPFEKIVQKTITNQKALYLTELNETKMEVEKEKDDVLAWIHEVKTPLTTLQLIIERVDDHDLRSQLSYEWLRIHLLLDQQLHQRRMPFMETDLYIEKVNLEEIVIREIKELRSWCLQKGVGFNLNIDESHVLSDWKWLSFIIRQLITNAVKYSERSHINIHSMNLNGHVQLVIQDFGRGISKKDLPRIFDHGFTSTSYHQDHVATGMGLYLVKQAAKHLRIEIGVESEENKGTTFTLTFAEENEFARMTRM